MLGSEMQRGRLDAEVVNQVLAAAGQRVPAKRKDLMAGLSGREIEVLHRISRGLLIKQIAVGVMARRVADLGLGLEVINGGRSPDDERLEINSLSNL